MVCPVSPGSDSHQARSVAEGFGAEAERYDRTRPHYPVDLPTAVLKGLRGNAVLDVGIGTGISALPFRDAGATVCGVEVDDRMADLARHRGFVVELGKFEDWDPRGRQFDAVIAGQTWHWIDPVAGAEKASEVLRPSGRLALFWNVANPAPEIMAEFERVYSSVDTGLPFNPWAVPPIEAYNAITDRAVDGIIATGKFLNPCRMRFDWTTQVSRDAWLDQVPSMGGHNRIAKGQLEELLAGICAVFDAQVGTIAMPYWTLLVMADRAAY